MYQFLPGDISDAIADMSGSIFGLLALVAGITKALDDNKLQIIPPNLKSAHTQITGALESLDEQLGALYSKFESLRKAEA